MDSKQAAHMNSSLNSIAKTLMSINRNLASLVEQQLCPLQDTGYTLIPEEGMGHKRPIYTRDDDIYRIEHPERCPQVDSDGPTEEMDPHWPHREDPICPDCEGTGQVLPAAVDMSDHCPCPTCEGSGDSTYHQEEIVSDCGKMLQQARTQPSTQEVIDNAIETLKNLKWHLRGAHQRLWQHIQSLIKQLEEIVSDSEGSGQSPTQQVRSDDPPTQQTIDDTVEALKNLKWRFGTHSTSTQEKHVNHLIKQLEEMREWLQN